MNAWQRFLVVMVVLATPAAAGNFLTNPNFTSDVAGWGPTLFLTWVGNDGYPGGSGPGCAEVRLDVTNGGLYSIWQTLPVTAGQTYTVSGWTFVPDDAGNVAEGGELAVDWYADSTYLSTSFFNRVATRGAWVQVTHDVVAPAGANQARADFGVRVPFPGPGTSWVRWDDVYFGTPIVSTASTVEYFVPGVAYTQGQLGTFWTTDLSVYNPVDVALQVEAAFLPGPNDNSAAPFTTLATIDPGETVGFTNIIHALGRSGTGGLRLRCSVTSGSAQAAITAHTWTPAPPGGTYGQGTLAVPGAGGIRYVITGLSQNAAYRTNVGVVNPWSHAVAVNLRVRKADGDIVADVTWNLGPYGAKQQGLPDLGVGSLDSGTLLVEGNGVLAYASVVDNVSGDASYLAAQPW